MFFLISGNSRPTYPPFTLTSSNIGGERGGVQPGTRVRPAKKTSTTLRAFGHRRRRAAHGICPHRPSFCVALCSQRVHGLPGVFTLCSETCTKPSRTLSSTSSADFENPLRCKFRNNSPPFYKTSQKDYNVCSWEGKGGVQPGYQGPTGQKTSATLRAFGPADHFAAFSPGLHLR